MKREAINEAEATLNEDILQPTIDNMLECRQDALEKVNSMFGTNITIEFNSIWKQNKKEEALAFDLKEAEIDSKEGGDANVDDRHADNGGENQADKE